MNVECFLKVVNFNDVHTALTFNMKEKYGQTAFYYIDWVSGRNNNSSDFEICIDYEKQKDDGSMFGLETWLSVDKAFEFIKEHKRFLFTDKKVVLDFIEISMILNNQMDCVFEKYNHEGWEVVHSGIQEKKSPVKS